ncbi:MAG: hypothetical protein J07HX64_02132 [halophilic archaeon J07HX64]|jgi:hypothetical protein|nr:MAG: hypothetical protein J07HX64_02132 [halophilic archaeon J07HX64]
MTDKSDTSARVGRRRWLSALGASLSVGVAGCLGDSEDPDATHESSDDSTTDGDTGDESSDEPDDSDTGGDSDSSGDGTGETDDTSGNGGSDDDAGGGDSGSEDDGEPAQSDVSVILTDLRAGQVPVTVDLGVDESAPVAVTVTNDADTVAEIPVTFAVVTGQDNIDDSPDGSTGQTVPTEDALATETLTVVLEGGTSERLTASGLTDSLESGAVHRHCDSRGPAGHPRARSLRVHPRSRHRLHPGPQRGVPRRQRPGQYHRGR